MSNSPLAPRGNVRRLSGRRLYAIGAAASLLAITACGADSGDAGGAGEPAKVGVALARSGPSATYGEGLVAGLEFETDRINEQGGVECLDDAPIELVFADTASDQATAANEARRLVTQEDVSALVAGTITPEGQAVLPVAQREGLPVLFGILASNLGYENGFTHGLPYPNYASGMMDFAAYLRDEVGAGIKDVVLTTTTTEAGSGILDALEAKAEELGFNVIESIGIPPEQEDYTSTVLRIRALAPDAVISFLYTEDGLRMGEARHALGYTGTNAPIFIGGTGGYTDPKLWDQMGEEIAAPALVDTDVFGLAIIAVNAEYEPMQQLLSDAEAAGAKPLDSNFVAGAQIARSLWAALSEACSTDPQDITEALRSLEIPAGDPHLYMPTVAESGLSFSDAGTLNNIVSPIEVWQSDGTTAVVYPTSQATLEGGIELN
ncbi:hypothetical protein CFI00_17260 [Nocardioides sp. S5]|uniref:ABC transporter substrate-binding protein n=1 Tax=Nocardioides sp. S5 TaxID=2017486 RepID=UPI001AF16E4B|nr:ABC transporter substrate-binding protein [Nocardioides sp. S5]QSR32212.1 hypothetical protein CFI00_17260 [Nocardioides sp. S5]